LRRRVRGARPPQRDPRPDVGRADAERGEPQPRRVRHVAAGPAARRPGPHAVHHRDRRGGDRAGARDRPAGVPQPAERRRRPPPRPVGARVPRPGRRRGRRRRGRRRRPGRRKRGRRRRGPARAGRGGRGGRPVIVLASLTALLPFLAAFGGMLFGPSLTRALGGRPGDPVPPRRNGPALIACAPMAVALVLSAVVAYTVWRAPGERTGALAVIDTGGVPIRIGLQVDGLSAVVALMVCCVALAVQAYSVAYLDGDRRYSSYAAFVSLFTAAMLLVVYSGDLLILYAGWEVMGICSYFLIGHHWEDRANS